MTSCETKIKDVVYFNSFYLKYLAPAVNSGKVAAKSILKNLTHTPYNFTFGLYLLADYASRKDEFKDVEGYDKILHECS